jgi:hypothetical protein
MKKLFIISAAALVAFASCSKENGTPALAGEGNVEITLLDANAGATRADAAEGEAVAGSADENKITQIEIFVFDDAGAALDEATLNEDGYVSIDFATAPTLPYKTQVKMSEGTNKDIIVVANGNIGAPTVGTDTFDTIMAKIAAASNTILDNDVAAVTAVPTDGFLMTGYTLTAPVVEGNANKIAVALDRAVARIETPVPSETLVVDLTDAEIAEVYGEGATKVEVGNIEFELDGFAVINGLPKTSVGFVGNKVTTDGAAGNIADITYSVWDKPQHASIVADGDEIPWNLWIENKTDAAGVLTPGAAVTDTARGPRSATNAEDLMSDNTPGLASEWEGAYSGDAFLTTGVVYVNESKPDWAVNAGLAGYDTNGVIALIIQGTLTSELTGEDETRYWRVNVREQDAYHILRNSSYHTAINTIVTPGYKTPQEAEEETPILPIDGEVSAEFEISINPWIHRLVGNGQI